MEETLASFMVLYNKPGDPAAFDRHYDDIHVPLVKKLAGLRRYVMSKGPIVTPAGPSDVYLVARLEFDSLAELQAAMASPEGRAAAEDVRNFADGGAQVLMFEERSV